MSQSNQKTAEAFRQLISRMKHYEEAIGLIQWDLRTGAPKKGVNARSDVLGTLSGEWFRLSTSEAMGRHLEELLKPDTYQSLDQVTQRMVTETKKEYDRSVKIPAEKYEAYIVLATQSESVWEEAKHDNDFSKLQPYLEKIVAAKQEFVELWGYEGNQYNTLLDMYEEGMTVEKLDQVFGTLRAELVPLLKEIQSAPKPDTSFLDQTFDIAKQKQFSLYMLKQLNYDFEAGRLDETAHPFATGLNPGDVRITTRYLPNDVVSALFGTIHECGHALYEQNISPDLIGTSLCGGTSMGIHESQSRFWENVIGRSYGFWIRYYGELQKYFPEQLGGVSVDAFYRAINRIEPSLIRIEADELTYNLHIMVRYELEKGLINGSIAVKDLPEAWNEKYREYLGVVPDSDATGVLQDVHWSGGDFGYFPSYSLGNMYAAQMTETIRKELSDFDGLVERGELLPVKEWLTEKVYRHGKLLTPNEIITSVTGEELNPAYLVKYLKDKYKPLYGLK